MTFAERLEGLRKKKGLTQKALADAINTTDAYISALETGRKLPSYITTEAIARVLGCNFQGLWTCVKQDRDTQAARKAQRRQLAFVAENVELLDTVTADIRELVQSLSDDPEFLRAALNLRKALGGKRRALVLQLLEEFAQDTD